MVAAAVGGLTGTGAFEGIIVGFVGRCDGLIVSIWIGAFVLTQTEHKLPSWQYSQPVHWLFSKGWGQDANRKSVLVFSK